MKFALLLAGVPALLVLPARADLFGSGPNTFTIDFVNIGDPGNSNDSGTTGGYFSPYGGVAYEFRMATYEVSRDMISNVNNLGGLAITLSDMTAYGGNGPNRPATGISWNEAARFVNWLNTSKGYSPAYKFTLQPGDAGYSSNAAIVLWTAGDAGYDASNPYRNANAYYFLPSEDEWYKAAYYSGSGSTYFDYATQQDAPNIPTQVSSGSAGAVYNFSFSHGPADIDDAGGASHYGTVGQNGNAAEWLENAFDGTNNSSSEDRAIRGMTWSSSQFNLVSSYRLYDTPSNNGNFLEGFRVASVPEPTAAMLMLGSGLMWLARRRREACL